MASSKNMPDWVMTLDPASYKPLAAIGGLSTIDAWRSAAALSDKIINLTSLATINLAEDARWQNIHFLKQYFGFSASILIEGTEGQDRISIVRSFDYHTRAYITINCGQGDDIVLASTRDIPSYYGGTQIVNGGQGNDILMGDDVRGDEGDDLLICTDGSRLDGGAGNDILTGVGYMNGGDGDDLLIAEGTNSAYFTGMNGGNGNDLLLGNGIINRFEASAGIDTVVGGNSSNDYLTVETRLTTGTDNTTYFRAGGGENAISVRSSGTVTSDLRTQNVTISDFGQIIGEGINDAYIVGKSVSVTGDANANRLNGFGENVSISSGSGNDTVSIGLNFTGATVTARADLGMGDDSLQFGANAYDYGLKFQIDAKLNGGGGTDTLSLSADTLNIAKGSFTSNFYGTGTFKNFESYKLSHEDNTVTGSSRVEKIDARGGDDIIRTGKGKDHVKLGKGNDTLIYEKADVVTARGTEMPDRILDFGKYADDYIYGPSTSEDSGPSHIPITTVDRINLNFLLAGHSDKPIDSVVHLNQEDKGTMLSVKINGSFVDVAFLKDWYGEKASDYVQDGFLFSA